MPAGYCLATDSQPPLPGHAGHNAHFYAGLHLAWGLAITALTILYIIGISRRPPRHSLRAARFWFRPLCMFAGLGLLAVLLISPFDSLAHQLVSVHMVQHLGVMLIAAPLLVFGRPLRIYSAALSPRACVRWKETPYYRHAQVIYSWIFHPTVAWCAFCAMIIFWHLPTPYFLAHRSVAVHALMQTTFLLSGLMFWSVILERRPRRLGYGPSIPYVLSAALVTSLPGALLSFAHRQLLSAAVAGEALPLGLTSLQDQQLAGLIMWIPMDLIFFVASACLFVLWLNHPAPHLRAQMNPDQRKHRDQ